MLIAAIVHASFDVATSSALLAALVPGPSALVVTPAALVVAGLALVVATRGKLSAARVVGL